MSPVPGRRNPSTVSREGLAFQTSGREGEVVALGRGAGLVLTAGHLDAVGGQGAQVPSGTSKVVPYALVFTPQPAWIPHTVPRVNGLAAHCSG